MFRDLHARGLECILQAIDRGLRIGLAAADKDIDRGVFVFRPCVDADMRLSQQHDTGYAEAISKVVNVGLQNGRARGDCGLDHFGLYEIGIIDAAAAIKFGYQVGSQRGSRAIHVENPVSEFITASDHHVIFIRVLSSATQRNPIATCGCSNRLAHPGSPARPASRSRTDPLGKPRPPGRRQPAHVRSDASSDRVPAGRRR